MASSSFSSTDSQTSWTPASKALWVCQDPAMDLNGAFKGTQGHFEARLEALRASGVAVTSQVFEQFEKVVGYIQGAYPNGVDLLGFRMHASEKSLPLSGQEGGSYSLEKPEEGLEAIKDLFSRVRKFLMIEGCQTGSGKNGILKYVVGLCDPGVVGIGSKGSQFEVGFDPTLPGYMRFECLESKQDITRIYYKRENGGVQNIPVDELMLLWDLLKDNCTTSEEKQRGFELCYKLLGERNDPATFSSIRRDNKAFIDLVLGRFKLIRKELLQVKVNKSGAKTIWVEMLGGLEALRCELGGDQESPEILVDEDERAKTSDQIVTSQGLLVDSWTPYQKVYRFLLGCAFIDKYKPLLMLFDDETDYGLASQGIKALSGLTIHGNDALSITTILAYYFPIIKKSYLVGRNSSLLKQWFEGISKGVCFNNMIKFIDEFYEKRIQSSKEDQLVAAILKDDGKEVWKLIKQGVDLTYLKLHVDTLSQRVAHPGNLFSTFLLLEQLHPEDEPKFMNDLQLEYGKSLIYIELDEQVVFISKYLSRKGNIKQAVDYAKLINDSMVQLNMLCACANTAAILGEIAQALEIIKVFTQLTASTDSLHDRTVSQRSVMIYQIMEMALKLEEFTEGLKVAEWIPDTAMRISAGTKIFDALLEKRSQDEVIVFLSDSVFGSSLLDKRTAKLLDEGNYDQALTIADAIKDPEYFDDSHAKIIRHLLEASKPNEAFAQALKIKSESKRDFFLRDIIESLVTNLDLQTGKRDVELVLDCFKFIHDLEYWVNDLLIAFLRLEQLGPDGEPKFISDLMLGYQTVQGIQELDRQVGLISKYLIGKGEVARAFNYAQLIKEPKHQLNVVSECAGAAATLGDIVLTQEVKRLCEGVKAKIKDQQKERENVRSGLREKIRLLEIDLQDERHTHELAMQTCVKAKMDFILKFNEVMNPFNFPTLALKEFNDMCFHIGYDISRVPLLNEHTTPKMQAVIQTHQIVEEVAKKIDEFQEEIKQTKLELSRSRKKILMVC